MGDALGLQTVRLCLLMKTFSVLQHSIHSRVLDLLVVVSLGGVLLFVKGELQRGVVPVLLLGRLMHRVGDEAEAGAAHHDDLEHPVPDVGYGESFVIAGLIAAWL